MGYPPLLGGGHVRCTVIFPDGSIRVAWSMVVASGAAMNADDVEYKQ